MWIAADDDRAVAGVVGFVLVLAAAVTYYSWAAQNDVPRVGAEHEKTWDDDVGAALARLAQSASERVGTGAAAREVLPPPPDAPTQSIPFLAPLRSARADGSIAYSDACGGATLLHASGTLAVEDLVDGARGCLTFRGDTAYADDFAYRVELGGLLRIQDGKAIVVVGPALDVDDDRVALTLFELRGVSQTLGLGGADAPVTLTPRPAAVEVTSGTNAAAASWNLTTAYPEAWRDWYEERFDAAGVPLGTSYACADPTASGPARAPCTLELELSQPTALAISYGRYDLRIG